MVFIDRETVLMRQKAELEAEALVQKATMIVNIWLTYRKSQT